MLGRSGLQVSEMHGGIEIEAMRRKREMFALFTWYVFDVLAIVKVGRHSSQGR
jgi:hypothetical protein